MESGDDVDDGWLSFHFSREAAWKRGLAGDSGDDSGDGWLSFNLGRETHEWMFLGMMQCTIHITKL